MSASSWIVKKPRPGAASGSGSSAFQVTIVEELLSCEKSGTETDSLISSEADIGESCSNSVPGSCGDESQGESSGHRNNSPGQFDSSTRHTASMKHKIPPLACPPRCGQALETANNAAQLDLAPALNTRSSQNKGGSENTLEEGPEQFSLGEKTAAASTPYLTPRLGWKEDSDRPCRPPTPDRNGFEAHSPQISTDSEEVAQLSARLGSPLPEDFYNSTTTTTTSSGDPRRYSNLIFERAQDFLMGWMVKHPPNNSDSIKMASPFSMSSNEGGSSSGQMESEVTVSDLVQQREGIPRQDSPVVLPKLTPLLPQGQRHAVPVAEAATEEIEVETKEEIEVEAESDHEQEPQPLRSVPSIPRSAGARERVKHSERWEDDDDSYLELSINTKSDSGTTETFGSMKLPFDENTYDQVLGARTSATRELPTSIAPRKSSKSVTSGRPPRPQQSQDMKPKRSDASRLANMLQRQNSEDLFADTARVRDFVRTLQSIARTGSITSVRRALGVEEVNPEIAEISQMVDALEEGDDDMTAASETSSEGNAARKLTMFWDAEEEELPEGPVFWSGETPAEVQRMVTNVIEEAEDWYSMDVEEAREFERERRSGVKTSGNEKFDDEVRLLTSNQYAAVAAQLREVIKVKSLRLDLDESSDFSGRSGSDRIASRPSTETFEEISGSGRRKRRNSHQSESSGRRSPTTKKGFQKLTSLFRRRASGKSRDSGSSFSSHTETSKRHENPPVTLNTVEEAPSDASVCISLPRVLEPHGSGSAVQTPHPLDDVMSTRNGGDQYSAKSLSGFITERSAGLLTDRSAGLPATNTSSKSIGSGKSEASSLEERFYMLKVNFVLKKEISSPPPEKHAPPRITSPAHSEASGSRDLRKSPMQRATSRSCSDVPDVEPLNPISLHTARGYLPTNDVDSILRKSKIDVFRLRGPLTESQLKSVLSINGKWKADWSLSDSYDSLCNVMELGWVFKKGLENSDTLIFESDAKECKSIARVAGLVNLTERRPWDQSVVIHRRRDLRRGPCQCWVERYDGGIILRMDWDQPVAGTCYEFIELTEDCQTMVLRQELFRKNDGPSSVVRMVFRRSG